MPKNHQHTRTCKKSDTNTPLRTGRTHAASLFGHITVCFCRFRHSAYQLGPEHRRRVAARAAAAKRCRTRENAFLAKLTGGCCCFISPQLTLSRNASSRIFLSRSAPGQSTSLFLRHGLARRWEWIVVQACSYDFTATTSQQRCRCDGSELRSTGARKGRVQVSDCLATGAHGCLNQLQHQFHHSAASEPEVMTSPDNHRLADPCLCNYC